VKIALFTRTAFHHAYFINKLQEKFEIACVVREAYPEEGENGVPSLVAGNLSAANGMGHLKEDALFLKRFYAAYSAGFRHHLLLGEYLKSPFDAVVTQPETEYLNVGFGEINSVDFVSFLRGVRPDVVAVLGSSVIKPAVISVPSYAMINLHSGLSPYYRGTWSYGWPVVNSEPEYIGATVHHVNPGIDTGDIIYQTRPVLAEGDDLNAIFLKVIAEGVELVARALGEIRDRGAVDSHRQPENVGKLYVMKDLTAGAAKVCLSNLEKGVIREYNADKKKRDSRVKLYGYVPPKLFTEK
jgi:methionyl-tRNA formyltransferase